jgi:hypothetical protein
MSRSELTLLAIGDLILPEAEADWLFAERRDVLQWADVVVGHVESFNSMRLHAGRIRIRSERGRCQDRRTSDAEVQWTRASLREFERGIHRPRQVSVIRRVRPIHFPAGR